MYDILDIFKQCAILPDILRITVSKCILYILIGSLTMALVPTLEGASFYGGVCADSSLSENVNEARCRGSCLVKYTLKTSPRDDTCKKNADCYMCWSICHLLLGDSPARSSLCSDRAACFPGCQTACRFYEFLPSQNLTPPLLHDLPPLPAQMSPPRLNRDGLLVWDTPKWPEGSYGPSEEDVVMYIIMTNMGGQWHQHIQTSMNSIRISQKVKNSGVRVLAVTSGGLIAYNESLHWNDTDADVVIPGHAKTSVRDDSTVYSTQASAVVVGGNERRAPSGHEFQHQLVGDNDGQDKKHKSNSPAIGYLNTDNSVEKKYSYDYIQEDSDSQPPSVTIDHSWMVNLTSKSVDLLASVEVMWDVRGSGPVDYLVTWTEATGGISGHLVSQQNVADISLWKGQQYSIQIELLDQYGNSVLRSIPRSISFSSKDSVPTIKTQSPEPVLSRRTTVLPPTTTTIGSLLTDGFMIGRRVKEQEFPDDTVWGRNEDPKDPQDQSWSDSEATSHDSNQFSTGNRLSFPDETLVENASSKYWNVVVKKRGKEDLDSLVNSQKIKNSDSSTDEVQSSSLLVWAACLGVGAVIISILIAMAVRTLKRNNSSKRQEICPNEDYLSETTTSSVNSSSITTTSQLTRGSQSSRPEEEQWNYESVYQVSNQPTAKIFLHRHPPPPPPPPIPLSSPPLTPIHLHHPVTPHYRHNHNLYHPYHHHSHPAQPSAAPARIDHASMIENYILSLDPSPVVKQVAY